jgi:hypothetical protein
MKNIFIRLALLWFLIGQMVCVCLPASTTRSLSRLEAAYAFKPSASTKLALDNEFDRVADYESQRATWRFAVVLAADVAIIFFCWNLGAKRQTSVPCPPVAPQPQPA